MPRTKVSKTNKRNREVAHREEKVREFESFLDGYVNALEMQGQSLIAEVETEICQLVQRTQSALLQMKFGDFLDMKLNKFSDWVEFSALLSTHGGAAGNASQSSINSSSATTALMRSVKASNPNDEGYLTDSTNSGGGSSLCADNSVLSTFNNMRGRTPGPLSSARARRPRRSRSACGDFVPPGTLLKPMPSSQQQQSDRMSRNKLRTPTAAPRHKAFSADRTPRVGVASSNADIFASPPSAFIRWPKPGELVLSTYGSPLVAQVMPDKFANVNIPVRDGVLSLRPKKLAELKEDVIESIDPETLNQLKTLHANLDMIMNMAERAAAKK